MPRSRILHHLSRIVVELHQRVEIFAAAGRLSFPARGGVVRVMHLEEAEIHEEGIGILGVSLQPVDSLGAHLVIAGGEIGIGEFLLHRRRLLPALIGIKPGSWRLR